MLSAPSSKTFAAAFVAATALAGAAAPVALADASATAATDGRFAVTTVLANHPDDFSVGVGVTSPWLAHGALAIQAQALRSWYAHGVDAANGEETWLPHATYKLGLLGGGLTANGVLRMYGSGGMLVIVPHADMSDEGTVTGGYGAFGFEMISGRNLNYYLELGANGIDARADKLPGKPMYANGFVSTVGFRYSL
jgi:hypothetical protein